jgi:hypothetical protein
MKNKYKILILVILVYVKQWFSKYIWTRLSTRAAARVIYIVDVVGQSKSLIAQLQLVKISLHIAHFK